MSSNDKEQILQEREGLLTGEETSKSASEDEAPRGWSRKAIIGSSATLILLLLSATLLPPYLGYGKDTKKDTTKEESIKSSSTEASDFVDTHGFQSNGTHNFKRTVLMVSIDGLRADYLDRGLTPHLLNISRTGLRAKWMKPIFPVGQNLVQASRMQRRLTSLL